MDLVKQSANEQVKITQSWAEVAAGAPAPATSSPTPPGSRPSLFSGPLNPHSSVSQPSVLSRSAIILDLARTNDRTSDFAQLKEKIYGALSQHGETKDVHCTGLQRRVGGEDHIKITFATEEAARPARQHSQWLQEPRFCEARLLGDQWYPIKVDRVNRSTIGLNFSTEITKEATETMERELLQSAWLSISA